MYENNSSENVHINHCQNRNMTIIKREKFVNVMSILCIENAFKNLYKADYDLL